MGKEEQNIIELFGEKCAILHINKQIELLKGLRSTVRILEKYRFLIELKHKLEKDGISNKKE